MVDLILIVFIGGVAYVSFRAGAKYSTFENAWNGAKGWFKKNVQD